MKILLDMQSLQTGSGSRGIGRYSASLAKAMARNAGSHDIFAVVNNIIAGSAEAVRKRFDGLIDPSRILAFDALHPINEMDADNAWRARASEHIRMHFIKSLEPDFVHVTSLFEGHGDQAATSVTDDLATAVTLYDLIPYLNQSKYLANPQARSIYMRKLESLRGADLWLAISESTRQEAIDAIGLDPGAVIDISAGTDDIFMPTRFAESERERLFARFGLRAGFLLGAGSIEPRKNHDKLIEAFAMIPKEIRRGRQLCIACQSENGNERDLAALAKARGLTKDEVVFLGRVNDEDLLWLYNEASVFVFPSLHEGFGLPALEAMQCGTATIGSNSTSIPEVIGREDALFDASDIRSISDSIQRVLNDDAFKKELERHAIEQSANFSWDKSARKALAGMEAKYDLSRLKNKRTAPSRRYDALTQGIRAIDVSHPTRDDVVNAANCISKNIETLRSTRAAMACGSLSWSIEGPLDSNYSLAIVNRETAIAMSDLGIDVRVRNTEGPGDYAPDMTFLSRHPKIVAMLDDARRVSRGIPDVVSRLLYPPRVKDMGGYVNALHHYAWEESSFPREWVDQFNLHLTKMTVLSEHVRKTMIDNGVTVDVAVSGCPIGHWKGPPGGEEIHVEGKDFRFLHVSSCFPRKGVDALLKAYGLAFTSIDNVSLIIKTFPNPHNNVRDLIDGLLAENPRYPDVRVIDQDIDVERMGSLYRQCHVLVAPSRAEGFGLPMAEAMISGIPVITTGWGGQCDFCNEENSWLIDYRFERAMTHFNLYGSYWAEPDIGNLAAIMREVAGTSPETRARKANLGRTFVSRRYDNAEVNRLLVEHVTRPAPLFDDPRIGWISTWNTRCGVATYSAHLTKKLSSPVTIFAPRNHDLVEVDGASVVRCWPPVDVPNDLMDLTRALDHHAIDVLVVQFNFGFFDLPSLSAFLARQFKAGKPVVVEMHSTISPPGRADKRIEIILEALKSCDRVIVHTIADLNRMKSLGLVHNVMLLPHGIMDDVAEPREDAMKNDDFVIASYGFCLPGKGLVELLEGFARFLTIRPKARLELVNAEYPVDASRQMISELKKRIRELKLLPSVKLTTEFLPDDVSLALLSEAHLIVFPYQSTGESASGAVRMGLAARRPVATTPLPIFEDLGGAVHRFGGATSNDIFEGLARLRASISTGDESVRKVAAEAANWRSQHGYGVIGARLEGMLVALYRAGRDNRPARPVEAACSPPLADCP